MTHGSPRRSSLWLSSVLIVGGLLLFGGRVAAQQEECSQTDGLGSLLADIVDGAGRWLNQQKHSSRFASASTSQHIARALSRSEGCEEHIEGRALTSATKDAISVALSDLSGAMRCHGTNGVFAVGQINGLYERDEQGVCQPTGALGIYVWGPETVLLTDAATQPQSVAADADEQLCLSLTHEIAHGVFGLRDPRTCTRYGDPMHNPVMTAYMQTVGWHPTGRALIEQPDNQSPTRYTNVSPMEDAAEAVALYRCNPEYLLQTAPLRHEFVRRWFEGEELENLASSPWTR